MSRYDSGKIGFKIRKFGETDVGREESKACREEEIVEAREQGATTLKKPPVLIQHDMNHIMCWEARGNHPYKTSCLSRSNLYRCYEYMF